MILITSLVITLFVGQLINLQVISAETLAEQARDSRTQRSSDFAHRGDITDADGVILATSLDTYIIAADQVAIAEFKPRTYDKIDGKPLTDDGPTGVAKLLAPVLGRPAPELAAELHGDNRYHILAKDQGPAVQRSIINLGLQAYIPIRLTSERKYPAGSIAGNVVGFVGADSNAPDRPGFEEIQTGQAGVEKISDKILAGVDGYELGEVGRGGYWIPTSDRSKVPAVDGQDIRLTIKRDIQWKAQDSADRATQETGSEYAIVVVQDVSTGALLALADSGTVSPEDKSDQKARPSRAISDIFDPGSTGKLVTMAAALELGIATPESQYTVPYRYTTPNGQTFKDSHEHPTQRLTLAGILSESSNTGTIQVGMNMPPQVRYDFLSKFGFGKPTGLGLPGESAGILRPLKEWDGRTEYAVLFGQGIAVNAVQASSVFSTIAHDGVRMTPHVIAGASSANGFQPAAQPPGEQVISTETAHQLLRMMEGVVADGTGRKAAVSGYRIAGKTGTAEGAGPDGRLTEIMSSFIGVAPADDPQVTVSVFLKNPETSSFGGDVAAPVFHDVMEFTLESQNIPPSREPYQPYANTW